MNYEDAKEKLLAEEGVELSTIMKHECLRYRGEFMAMLFIKEHGLIIKVAEARVQELISEGTGESFNFTGKTFKEWVLIPMDYEERYESLLYEALNYQKQKFGS